MSEFQPKIIGGVFVRYVSLFVASVGQVIFCLFKSIRLLLCWYMAIGAFFSLFFMYRVYVAVCAIVDLYTLVVRVGSC